MREYNLLMTYSAGKTICNCRHYNLKFQVTTASPNVLSPEHAATTVVLWIEDLFFGYEAKATVYAPSMRGWWTGGLLAGVRLAALGAEYATSRIFFHSLVRLADQGFYHDGKGIGIGHAIPPYSCTTVSVFGIIPCGHAL